MENDLLQQYDDGTLAGAGQEMNLGLRAWSTRKDFAASLKNIVAASAESLL